MLAGAVQRADDLFLHVGFSRARRPEPERPLAPVPPGGRRSRPRGGRRLRRPEATRGRAAGRRHDSRRHPRRRSLERRARQGPPRPFRGRAGARHPRRVRAGGVRPRAGLPARGARHRDAGRRRHGDPQHGRGLRGARRRAARLAQVEPWAPHHGRRRGRAPEGARGDAGRIAAAHASRRGTERRARRLALPAARAARALACEGPRIAAVSAFGFGGNNAHLIVSEDAPELDRPATLARARGRDARLPSLAVVGLGCAVASAADRPRFAEALFSDESLLDGQGEGPDGPHRAGPRRAPLSRRRTSARRCRSSSPRSRAATEALAGSRSAAARADRDLRRDGARPRGRPVGDALASRPDGPRDGRLRGVARGARATRSSPSSRRRPSSGRCRTSRRTGSARSSTSGGPRSPCRPGRPRERWPSPSR